MSLSFIHLKFSKTALLPSIIYAIVTLNIKCYIRNLTLCYEDAWNKRSGKKERRFSVHKKKFELLGKNIVE